MDHTGPPEGGPPDGDPPSDGGQHSAGGLPRYMYSPDNDNGDCSTPDRSHHGLSGSMGPCRLQETHGSHDPQRLRGLPVQMDQTIKVSVCYTQAS